MGTSKKVGILIGLLVAGCMCLFLFHASILHQFANFFQVGNASKGADAIVCLSGGKITRVPHCLRLWKEGYSGKLFVTNEKAKNADFADLETGNLEFAEAVAKRMNLQAKWGVLPSRDEAASSTFDEAADALAYAKNEKWKRIIIVTDEFHTRRALLAFKKVFKGSSIEVEVAGARNEVFNAKNWWKTDSGILAYLSESIKLPIYFLWSSEPEWVENL